MQISFKAWFDIPLLFEIEYSVRLCDHDQGRLAARLLECTTVTAQYALFAGARDTSCVAQMKRLFTVPVVC